MITYSFDEDSFKEVEATKNHLYIDTNNDNEYDYKLDVEKENEKVVKKLNYMGKEYKYTVDHQQGVVFYKTPNGNTYTMKQKDDNKVSLIIGKQQGNGSRKFETKEIDLNDLVKANSNDVPKEKMNAVRNNLLLAPPTVLLDALQDVSKMEVYKANNGGDALGKKSNGELGRFYSLNDEIKIFNSLQSTTIHEIGHAVDEKEDKMKYMHRPFRMEQNEKFRAKFKKEKENAPEFVKEKLDYYLGESPYVKRSGFAMACQEMTAESYSAFYTTLSSQNSPFEDLTQNAKAESNMFLMTHMSETFEYVVENYCEQHSTKLKSLLEKLCNSF